MSFAAASRFVRPDDLASLVTAGPDVDRYVQAVRRFTDAGFTHVALIQVGDERQEGFLEWARAELLPALREL